MRLYARSTRPDNEPATGKRDGVKTMSKVRNTRGRNALLATVFALTVAAGITGATYTGATKETSIDEACAHVTWPMIPAYCLQGAEDRPVRMVSVDRAETSALAQRFAVAFE